MIERKKGAKKEMTEQSLPFVQQNIQGLVDLWERERPKIDAAYERFYQLTQLLHRKNISGREFFRRLMAGKEQFHLLVQINLGRGHSEWVWVSKVSRRKLRIEDNADGVWLPRITFWVGVSRTRRLRITRTEAWYSGGESAQGARHQARGDWIWTDTLRRFSKRETAKAILEALIRATPPPERDD